MSPIYTKTGDSGMTSLFGGVRVSKDTLAIELCGTIDELSASLGIVRTEKELSPFFADIILRIQQELILFCADIAADSERILPEHVQQIEKEIDKIESAQPSLRDFILPGESRWSALLHLSRTICRRAERHLVSFLAASNLAASNSATSKKSRHLLPYLNRLSDLLFVMARG